MKTDDPKTNGCPAEEPPAPADRDKDGIPDADDACGAGLSIYPCVYDPSDVPFQYYAPFRDNPTFLRDYTAFAKDLAAGKLPQVSFVKAIGYRSEHPGLHTTISAGTLELALATLATNSTVSIASSAVLKLDFSTTNKISALVLNGVSQPGGVYGSSTPGGYLTGTGYLQVPLTGPSGPATITNSVTGGGSTLSLSWPAGQGWRLQMQTNSLTTGLGTNWIYITDGSLSSTNITIDANKPTVFYRLTYP